jgi:SET domain-containing protein
MKRTILQTRFVVRKSRPGLGHGLFATQWLRSGDFVLEYQGSRIPTPIADALPSRYLFAVDEQWTIDGSDRENVARYINHSCDANCECDLRDGRILIFAARDIEKGEEITIDYGPEYFEEFIKPRGCKCAQCVGVAAY